MPPDAEKLRQRNGANILTKDDVVDADYDDDAASTTPSSYRICKSTDELKPHEIAIDGIIYDLTGFQHPGGDQINLFGGNDVTVQYRMIHAYHTAKHLEKLGPPVGKLANYTSEYQFGTAFEHELKREVFQIVRRGREFGTPGWYARAVSYVAFFCLTQYLWMTTTTTSWALALLFGLAQAFIGLNVQHDANHGASSKRPWINDLFGFGATVIGGDKWLWMEQHWTHHTYTNHAEMDPDSFGAEPMLLFNNYALGHKARTWLHRYQVFFYLPVLAGYWVSSVFNPQVFDLKQRGAESVGFKMDSDFVLKRRKYAVAMRFLYIYMNIVAPFMNQGLTWAVFANIMLMGAAESLTLATLFSLSHNFENADRDPTGPVSKSGAPVDWYKTQVETSCTYGGFVSGCLTGGLNFQVEHHLFPRMSSAWYPYIAPTVRKICEKHGVRYVYYPWIWQNFISTLRYMNAAGNGLSHFRNPFKGDL